MNLRSSLTLWIALMMTLTCGVARAESESELAKASAAQREGLSLLDSGDYSAAQSKFDYAYTVLKTSDALFHLAHSEQLLGRQVDALKQFRQWLKITKDTEQPPSHSGWSRRQVVNAVNVLGMQVGHIAVDVPRRAQAQ